MVVRSGADSERALPYRSALSFSRRPCRARCGAVDKPFLVGRRPISWDRFVTGINRHAGQVTSSAKAAAARANGTKGGRPRPKSSEVGDR